MRWEGPDQMLEGHNSKTPFLGFLTEIFNILQTNICNLLTIFLRKPLIFKYCMLQNKTTVSDNYISNYISAKRKEEVLNPNKAGLFVSNFFGTPFPFSSLPVPHISRRTSYLMSI